MTGAEVVWLVLVLLAGIGGYLLGLVILVPAWWEYFKTRGKRH